MDKIPSYIPREQQEKFEDFLMGNLTAAQRLEFDAELEADPVFKERFLEFKDLFLAVGEYALRERLNEFHQEKDRSGTRVKRSYGYLFKIASCLVLLIALGGFWLLGLPNPDQKLYKRYFRPDPGLPTVMGTNDNYDFYEAMVDYKVGDYQKAITLWEKQLINKPGNDTLTYFLGSAYLALGNEDASIRYLLRTLTDRNTVFKDETMHYLGMGYLKKGEMGKAREYLSLSGLDISKKVLDEMEE